jgi:hypothetical protein
MTWSRVENGCVFDLPRHIGEQQLIEIIDEGLKLAASSHYGALRLPGAD